MLHRPNWPVRRLALRMEDQTAHGLRTRTTSTVRDYRPMLRCVAKGEVRWQLAQLRRLRGMTQSKLAASMNVATQAVSRWETGHSDVALDNIQPLACALDLTVERLHRVLDNVDDELSGGTGETETIQRLVPEWLTAYVAQEQSASRIQSYESNVVHGLLQTRDYAQVVASESDYTRGRASSRTDKLVQLRLRRQAALTRAVEPLELEVVMSETTLRTRVDGRETMHHQLRHIVDMADLPNITIHILPFSSGYHTATRGSFTLLTFPWEAESSPTTGYTESYIGGNYIDTRYQIDHFAILYRHLRQMALTPSDSIKFVQQVAEEYVR